MAAEDGENYIPKRCKYCNAKFNDELRELLQEDEDPVYCELCGAEVRIQHEEKSQTSKNGSRGQSRSKITSKKKKSKHKIKQKPHVQNPITQIAFDPEFPLIFKENLMLVISRITYLAIKKLDDIEALKSSNRSISIELLDQLEHALKPVIWAKIKINFLGKLHKLTIDQFYEHLKLLQKKIGKNEEYREHFVIFLRYVIHNTFRIISEIWDTPEIPKFFHIIRNDLKNYGFDAFTKEQQNNTTETNPSIENDFGLIHENDLSKPSQLPENIKSNNFNELCSTNCMKITENIEKNSSEDSLSLKEELFEDFLEQKENIKKGMYIPKFRNFQNIPKYEGLTKKYFYHVRNEWFREILHKDSFIEFRNEIKSKKFFQNDKELSTLIETNQYPEGILIYSLINNLELSFPKLEKAICRTNNNNIIRVLQNRSIFNWEGLTSKIKLYILSIKDKSLKQQAIKDFQRYLKTKVYNGFKRNSFPRVEYFTLRHYPEGWLILKLCEINLISDTKLGKLIDYPDLAYHLTKLRALKGGRIKSIKVFISGINNKEKREKSQRILSNYIEFVVFSQLNREKVEEIEDFLDYKPKKWLIGNLCVIYLVLIRDFGKEIEYEDIKTTVHTHYDFSDIIIKKIRTFINKTKDLQKKEKSNKVLAKYLKRAIYYKLKTTDLPDYKEFKSKMHPALWLIIQICSIYLLHPFELEKFINYAELSKRLKVVSYFTNKTIVKFRNFIKEYGNSKQNRMAREAIIRFLEVRNKAFQRYTGPKIQNLEKLIKFPELVGHLEYVYNLGTFPEEILEGYHEYPRISQFNQQFRYIKTEKKRDFIENMIANGFIRRIDTKNDTIHDSIYNLIMLSKNIYYKPSEIYASHDSSGHEFVLNKILENEPNSICMEIPIWMRFKDHYLTGHIDLILVIDGTIFVCDYKPDETPNPETTRLSYSFMRSIPQVASYALVLKKLYNIDDIMCITFNKKGIWIYEPKETLAKLNNFIKKNKQYKISDRPWEKYFL